MITAAVQSNSSTPVENKSQTATGIEDLFKDSPNLTLSSVPAKPQSNIKDDIMGLFEKVNYVFL